jgi:hypothetical protein
MVFNTTLITTVWINPSGNGLVPFSVDIMSRTLCPPEGEEGDWDRDVSGSSEGCQSQREDQW